MLYPLKLKPVFQPKFTAISKKSRRYINLFPILMGIALDQKDKPYSRKDDTK